MAHTLEIKTDFPGGNACILEIVPEKTIPEIHFTPSPSGGPEAMWFFFQIEVKQNPPAEIRIVMHFVENLLGGTAESLLPVFKTGSSDWSRVSCTKISEQNDGRHLVSWIVPGNEGGVSTALCYPYGLEEINLLLTETAPCLSHDHIGITPANNPIPRISNSSGSPGSKRCGIYCTARLHSGEVSGAWLLDGFLRKIAEAEEGAPMVWAVPFANLDGVLAGHYGKDSFPYDFNRSWGSGLFPKELRGVMGSEPMRHEVKCIQNDMLRWSKRCRPVLQLDFHAPGLSEAEGIYCFIQKLDSDGLPDADHKPWVDGFRTALKEKRLDADDFVKHGRYQSRWNTARVGDFAVDALKIPHFSFETPYARRGGFIFKKEDYQEAGRKIAEAAIESISGI